VFYLFFVAAGSLRVHSISITYFSELRPDCRRTLSAMSQVVGITAVPVQFHVKEITWKFSASQFQKLVIFIFFYNTGVLNSGLMLARQALYT
jgi:hypothetical protein